MPDAYEVELSPAAVAGFSKLDRSDQLLVTKQLEKLKRAPELGELLGHKMGIDLAGYRKMYAARKRVRIIYQIVEARLLVTVIAIGPRADARAYRIAGAEAARRLRRIQ